MPKLILPYTAEFHQQIVDLACAGRAPAQPSRGFGPTAQGIANSIYLNGRDCSKPFSGKESLTTAEREDMVHLRRRLRQAEQVRHPGKGSAEHGAVHTSARYAPPSFQLGQPRHQHRLWQQLPQNRHAGSRRAQFVMPATTQWPKASSPAWNVSRLTCVAGKSRVDAGTALFTSIVGWYGQHRRHSTLNYLFPINFKRKHIEHEERAQKHGLPNASAGPPQAQTAAVDNPAPVQSSA